MKKPWFEEKGEDLADIPPSKRSVSVMSAQWHVTQEERLSGEVRVDSPRACPPGSKWD